MTPQTAIDLLEYLAGSQHQKMPVFSLDTSVGVENTIGEAVMHGPPSDPIHFVAGVAFALLRIKIVKYVPIPTTKRDGICDPIRRIDNECVIFIVVILANETQPIPLPASRLNVFVRLSPLESFSLSILTYLSARFLLEFS